MLSISVIQTLSEIMLLSCQIKQDGWRAKTQSKENSSHVLAERRLPIVPSRLCSHLTSNGVLFYASLGFILLDPERERNTFLLVTEKLERWGKERQRDGMMTRKQQGAKTPTCQWKLADRMKLIGKPGHHRVGQHYQHFLSVWA